MNMDETLVEMGVFRTREDFQKWLNGNHALEILEKKELGARLTLDELRQVFSGVFCGSVAEFLESLRIDTGDRIVHLPSSRIVTTAFSSDGEVMPISPKPEFFPLEECKLLEKATKARRMDLIRYMAEGEDGPQKQHAAFVMMAEAHEFASEAQRKARAEAQKPTAKLVDPGGEFRLPKQEPDYVGGSEGFNIGSLFTPGTLAFIVLVIVLGLVELVKMKQAQTLAMAERGYVYVESLKSYQAIPGCIPTRPVPPAMPEAKP